MQTVQVHYSDDEITALVNKTGPEEVGVRYVERSGRSLAATREGRSPTIQESDDDPEKWIDDAVDFGEYLPCETRFQIVIAAITCASNDDDVMWCIADMAVSHLVFECSMHDRFHAERSNNPSVDHMFRLMQHYYRVVCAEPHAGWWEDDYRRYLASDTSLP